MTNKYVARVKGTIVGNRTSKAGRVYTHAIVVNGHDKTDEVVTWCGRLDLARREQRKYELWGFSADIVEAELLQPAKKN